MVFGTLPVVRFFSIDLCILAFLVMLHEILNLTTIVMSTYQNKNRTEHFCRALPVKFLFMITIGSSPHLYETLSTLPWILTFLCIWQELSVKLDDNSVVAICILCHIHIKSKINGTHNGVAALLMDDVLDRRAVCIDDLM